MGTMHMSQRRIVIVGAGFAGLCAAYTLMKRGITPLLLEAKDRAGGRGMGERVDGFSLDMGAFVFTSTYDTAFRICEELGLPLVGSKMKFGHYRNGRWVTTTPDQTLWNFARHLPAAITMGFLSPSGMRSGFKVMRQMYRQSEYMSFASDSRLADIDDDETFGEYLERLGVPENLQLTLRGPLEMILGDPAPAGQALMRAYIGETMLHAGRVYMPERGTSSLSEALASACSDAIRVATPARRIVVEDGKATSVVVDGETIEADTVICAVPGTKVPDLIPDLPEATRRALSTVSYSTGCRVVIGLDHSPSLPAGMARSTQRTRTPHSCWTGQSSCLPARLLAITFSTCSSDESALRNSFRSTTMRLSVSCWAPFAGRHLRAPLFPVTTRVCSTGCTAGKRRCAWGRPACSPRQRRYRGSLQGTSTTCSWRAITWACRRSTAPSPVVTGPPQTSQTCWSPAPTRRGGSVS